MASYRAVCPAIAMLLGGCSVPQAVIPANASCDDLLVIHRDAVDYARVKSAAIAVRSAAQAEADRIEAVMSERGCLAPE